MVSPSSSNDTHGLLAPGAADGDNLLTVEELLLETLQLKQNRTGLTNYQVGLI